MTQAVSPMQLSDPQPQQVITALASETSQARLSLLQTLAEVKAVMISFSLHPPNVYY